MATLVASSAILVGAFAETAELCRSLGVKIVGAIDKDPAASSRNGIEYLGSDDQIERLYVDYAQYAVIITPDTPKVRTRLADLYTVAGFQIRGLVSSDALISPSAVLNSTSVVHGQVIVSADVRIGCHTRLNVAAMVMHDTIVEDYATVAPRAVLLGGITIGFGSYVGANSTVLPNIKVGPNAIIGAGSVVTRNVEANDIVAGNPARKIGQNS